MGTEWEQHGNGMVCVNPPWIGPNVVAKHRQMVPLWHKPGSKASWKLTGEHWSPSTKACLSATVFTTSHVWITLGLNPRLRYVWLGQWNCFSNRYVVVNDSVLCKYKPRQAVAVRLGCDVCVSTNGWLLRRSYRPLDAILTQRKNRHLEFLRLAAKYLSYTQQYQHTVSRKTPR
jgi:hypothetical protein